MSHPATTLSNLRFRKRPDPETQAVLDRILREHSITQPPVPLPEIIRTAGYRVATAEFNQQSGLTGALRRSDKVIFVDSAEPVEVQNWTTARAFAFDQLYPPTPTVAKDDFYFVRRRPIGAAGTSEEQRTDMFAAFLLVPEQFLTAYAEFATLRSLAELFIVPEEIIRWRID